MRRLFLAFILTSATSLAADPQDQSFEVAVSDSTPTELKATSACLTCKTVLVYNGGINTIYCAPQSDVTFEDGFPVPNGESRVFPAVRIWCIAISAAQTGTSGDNTRVWPSAQ